MVMFAKNWVFLLAIGWAVASLAMEPAPKPADPMVIQSPSIEQPAPEKPVPAAPTAPVVAPVVAEPVTPEPVAPEPAAAPKEEKPVLVSSRPGITFLPFIKAVHRGRCLHDASELAKTVQEEGEKRYLYLPATIFCTMYAAKYGASGLFNLATRRGGAFSRLCASAALGYSAWRLGRKATDFQAGKRSGAGLCPLCLRELLLANPVLIDTWCQAVLPGDTVLNGLCAATGLQIES